jgi:glycosyltransferase involved in cell wall biosynthesis
MKRPSAAIVITTKNRKDELGRAIESCLRQDAPAEVWIVDDGSDDGTADFVRERYPSVRVCRSETSRGYIVQRNEAARLAAAEVIFSLDDDAEFSDPGIVAAVLKEFSDPRIVAVAIPFINVNSENVVRQRAPEAGEVWITNEYIGTAYAIRRRVFLEMGGYRDFFFHQGEEGDLCIRLLNHGYVVRLGSSAPILHYESPNRSFERMNVYGQRNLMLFAWYNVPLPEFLVHLPGTAVKGILWGLRHGSFWWRVRGTGRGMIAVLREFKRRAPVGRATYWRYRRLKKHGPISMANLSTLSSEAAYETR